MSFVVVVYICYYCYILSGEKVLFGGGSENFYYKVRANSLLPNWHISIRRRTPSLAATLRIFRGP